MEARRTPPGPPSARPPSARNGASAPTGASGAHRGSKAAAWLRLARPKQWLKNLLVLAAPGAAGVLTEREAAVDTAIAFVCFCLVSSGTYYLNDALDVDADRHHPVKQRRPIASGMISARSAIVAGVLLQAVAIGLSLFARPQLAFVLLGYIGLTAAYSLWLKHEAVLDLGAVAAGFVLRAIAGGVAVGVEISPWFLIVAGAGSLFIVTGKRSRELLELGDDASDHRRSLDLYSQAFLVYVRAVSSSVAILAYCLWAFEESGRVGDTTWFELSIVPYVLGILRYAFLLDRGGSSSAPEEIILGDKTLLAIGLAWTVTFAIAVHG